MARCIFLFGKNHSYSMSYIFLLLSFLFTIVYCNQWNYGHLGPDIWSDYYPLCSGKSQSPINILTACTTYRKYQSFKFTSAYDEKHYFTLKNNGHTVIGILNNEYKQSPIQLTGGGLNGTFDFVNFHLHWGENYKSGSEHQM
jgi:carbonic anhydrase